MSGTGPRENVFATRMALTNTKLRLKGAQTGHSLLAKKRDALTTRFRAILKKVDEVSRTRLALVRRKSNARVLGKAKDGPGHAVGLLFYGGGHVRDGGHIVSGPGAGQDGHVQSQVEAGERLRCSPPRV
jgi:hypothetical protein